MITSKVFSHFSALVAALLASLLIAGCKTETPRGSVGNLKELKIKASRGDAETQYALGVIYEQGKEVRQDYVQAANWYGEAAGKGIPWAQFSLGRMYYNGDGVAQNRGESFYWVEKAAAKGLAEAQALLGALYGSGDGIEKDDDEAFKWMTKAAGQGMANAQSTLGAMYAGGVVGKTNLIQAYKWFSLAAKQGDDSAKTNLTALEGTLSAAELSQAQQLVGEFKPFMTNGANCSWSGEQTFSLKPESGTATGFFVTDDGYLVSNAHVVKGAGEIFAVTPGGTLPAEVVKVDADRDLALLKVAGQFSPLPVADSRKIKLGSPVITVGFPDPPLLGFSPKFARGDIAGLLGSCDDPLRFQISVPMQPGNSGGPLVDHCGNVVGIVSQQLDVMRALDSNGQLPQNVNYAIKSQYLLGFLETIPEVSTKLKPPRETLI